MIRSEYVQFVTMLSPTLLLAIVAALLILLPVDAATEASAHAHPEDVAYAADLAVAQTEAGPTGTVVIH